MDSATETLFAMPTLDRLVTGNVLAILPVLEQMEPSPEGDIDFTPGALVVHLGELMEPRLTWVGATELFEGMQLRSEIFPTAEAALGRAAFLAGWTEVGV